MAINEEKKARFRSGLFYERGSRSEQSITGLSADEFRIRNDNLSLIIDFNTKQVFRNGNWS